MSVEQPNYTMVPNVLFDAMSDMSEAELKCTLAIVRKIIGFHKDGPEPISYSQLEIITGLSRQGVTTGVKAAIERGFVRLAGHGARGINLFTLNFSDQSEILTSQGGEHDDQSTELTSTSQKFRPELVNGVDSQKKVFKEKTTTTGAPATSDVVVDEQQLAPKGDESESDTAARAAELETLTETANAIARVSTAYEHEIGMITHTVKTLIVEAVEDYPVGWILDAISVAVKHNARKWAYVAGVLANWRREGRGVGPFGKPTPRAEVHFPTPVPDCPVCGGAGQLVNAHGATVPCTKCLEAEHGAAA